MRDDRAARGQWRTLQRKMASLWSKRVMTPLMMMAPCALFGMYRKTSVRHSSTIMTKIPVTRLEISARQNTTRIRQLPESDQPAPQVQGGNSGSKNTCTLQLRHDNGGVRTEQK